MSDILTAADMARYYLEELSLEDIDLATALFELNRTRLSPWAQEDLPIALEDFLKLLGQYRMTVHFLSEQLEKVLENESEDT
jgi:hypothetical protein